MLIQFLREIIFCCNISMLGLSWVNLGCRGLIMFPFTVSDKSTGGLFGEARSYYC